MSVICITGGIGAGKSVVAKVIEQLGYPVYYSDQRAKAMYFVPDIKQKIIDLLGKAAYLSDKEIDKKYIAAQIFSNPDKLSKINAIIHQAVKEDFEQYIQQHAHHRLIFKESALILEAQLQHQCDKIILVTAPLSVKLKRLQERDNFTEQEIMQRMGNQWSDEKKIPYAHYVIENDDKRPLLPQILFIIQQLEKE